MDYDGGMTANDGFVGLSPGGGQGNPGVGLNLDLTNGPIPTGQAAYERFTLASVNDVKGRRVTFHLDANGYPILQN
jgi:hypothetical protein